MPASLGKRGHNRRNRLSAFRDSNTGSGSFDVIFSDGSTTSTVSVQVQDSDGTASNVSSITFTADMSPNPANGSMRPARITIDVTVTVGNDSVHLTTSAVPRNGEYAESTETCTRIATKRTSAAFSPSIIEPSGRARARPATTKSRRTA